MFKSYLDNDEDPDCSWSILYVVLGLVGSVAVIIGTLWAAVYFCINGCFKRTSNGEPGTYKLIEDSDDPPPCKHTSGRQFRVVELTLFDFEIV